MTDDSPLCSTLSIAAHEPLYGTVKHTTHWLLLEYDARWESDALDGSTLPAAVKQQLADFKVRVPQARVLMIRQKPRLHMGGIALYVVRSTPTESRIHAFDLAQYDDLLVLDLVDVAHGAQKYDAARQDEPLTLICTHGRRDRCCARYGIAVFEQWAAQDGARVWQTSHVGGHRFAANVLLFPEGIAYGRVRPETVLALRDARAAGQIVLAHYRGRSDVPPPAHVAEVVVRESTGILDQAGLVLDTVENTNDHWRVVWRETASIVRHTLIMAQRPLVEPLPTSCGAEPELLMQYVVVEYTRDGA